MGAQVGALGLRYRCGETADKNVIVPIPKDLSYRQTSNPLPEAP